MDPPRAEDRCGSPIGHKELRYGQIQSHLTLSISHISCLIIAMQMSASHVEGAVREPASETRSN